MEEQTRVTREYGFADWGKVLLAGLKRAVLCALSVGILLGGALTCFSVLITHDEYTATIVKINDDYDVPVVRATFKEEIQKILPEALTEKTLNEEQLNVLSREFDEHISINEPSENGGIYTFILTSFKSSIVPLTETEFSAVMTAVTENYQKKYTEKIISSYTVESNTESGLNFSAIRSDNYYLQAEILDSYLNAVIKEIEVIADLSLNDDIQTTGGAASSSSRSDFSAYRCAENDRRVSDVLLALEGIRYEISYAKSYVSSNGIEKEGAKPMTEYVQGQLLKDADSYPWIILKDNFGENSVYQRASETEKRQFVAETERLIESIVLQLQTILDDYNLIARSFAQSVVSDYVIISAVIEEKSVGAIDAFTVIVITVAGVVISVFFCYVLQFYKMQKEGSIGVEVTETKDEE